MVGKVRANQQFGKENGKAGQVECDRWHTLMCALLIKWAADLAFWYRAVKVNRKAQSVTAVKRLSRNPSFSSTKT